MQLLRKIAIRLGNVYARKGDMLSRIWLARKRIFRSIKQVRNDKSLTAMRKLSSDDWGRLQSFAGKENIIDTGCAHCAGEVDVQLMRLAVGLAFRETSRAARNKWRGAARTFLARCRVSASAAAQRMAAAGRSTGSRSRRNAIPSSPEGDRAGPDPVDCLRIPPSASHVVFFVLFGEAVITRSFAIADVEEQWLRRTQLGVDSGNFVEAGHLISASLSILGSCKGWTLDICFIVHPVNCVKAGHLIFASLSILEFMKRLDT